MGEDSDFDLNSLLSDGENQQNDVATQNKWSHPQVVEFIDAFREHPALWAKKDAVFKDINAKTFAWNDLSEKFSKYGFGCMYDLCLFICLLFICVRVLHKNNLVRLCLVLRFKSGSRFWPNYFFSILK